jgi:hypothetical protein
MSEVRWTIMAIVAVLTVMTLILLFVRSFT